MESRDNENSETEVSVLLPYDAPVVGVEFKPSVRLLVGGKYLKPLDHSFIYSWYRLCQKQLFCSVHCTEIATVQCTTCVTLKLPVRESYHCSAKCFSDVWNIHLGRHLHVKETVSGRSNGDGQASRRLRTCGSWPSFDYDSSFDNSLLADKQHEDEWIEVGYSETYIPSMDDSGLLLKLESEAVDSLGLRLSSRNVIVTEPVVIAPAPQPRCMIQIGPSKISRNFNFLTQSSGSLTFSVLSYNILSDLYCYNEIYSHCPVWARAWEYRRENLLKEIIGYNADILCLQEVQSDHFENFLKPGLTKCGYSVYYKKKTQNLFTSNQFTIDGCATFFRRDKFKAVLNYELDFDKMAALTVDKLKSDKKQTGRIRLTKDNIALVVKLELENSKIPMPYRSIVVANTHIHSDSYNQAVKLFQVSTLINTLGIFAGAPILICGDMNSSPRSDPYKLIVTGSLNPVKTVDPLGICPHLKLQHELCLASAYSSLLQSERVEEQEKQKMNFKTKEPLFTRLIPKCSETLDYIFYSETCLKVEGLLELLDSNSLGGAGLPSPLWSSDHIALMANFSINPPFQPGSVNSCQQEPA